MSGTVKSVKYAKVKERHWGPNDDYLIVEVQVHKVEGFQKDDDVLVTIEKVDEESRY